MWEVVWLIEAKLHSHPPGHFGPHPLLPPSALSAALAASQPCELYASPVARLSPIARTLRDRGNPPPSPEEEEIEYDTYGWFNFDSDSEGVRHLDRQWVSAHALALVDAAGWKAAVDVWHKKVTPTSTHSREGPVWVQPSTHQSRPRHGTRGLFAAISNQLHVVN